MLENHLNTIESNDERNAFYLQKLDELAEFVLLSVGESHSDCNLLATVDNDDHHFHQINAIHQLNNVHFLDDTYVKEELSKIYNGGVGGEGRQSPVFEVDVSQINEDENKILDETRRIRVTYWYELYSPEGPFIGETDEGYEYEYYPQMAEASMNIVLPLRGQDSAHPKLKKVVKAYPGISGLDQKLKISPQISIEEVGTKDLEQLYFALSQMAINSIQIEFVRDDSIKGIAEVNSF